MSVIKIDIEKPSQEFEIAGKVYELNYDDDSLKQYYDQLNETVKEIENTSKIDVQKLSDKEIDEIKKKQRVVIQRAMDSFLGENSFEQIYEDTGRSVFNLLKIFEVLAEFIVEKMGGLKEKKADYYVKK